jgi:O-antigen/teichoic acid export membrane protein
LKNAFVQFARRPLVRNIAAAAGGTAAAQAITLGFAPLLTRLYGPEAYGQQGVFLSVVGLLGGVAGLAFPMAIVLPATEAEARAVARLALRVGAASALLVALVLAVGGRPLLGALGVAGVGPVLMLVPVATFATVLAAVLAQWLVRHGAFALGARWGVAGSLLLNAGKAAGGAWAPSASMLIGAHTVGMLAGTALTWAGWRRAAPAAAPPPAAAIEPPLRDVAHRYRDFALLRTPQNLINAASQSLPLLLLAHWFGAASAGRYALAMAVLGVPAALIGNAVLSVLYPRLNDAALRREDLRGLVVRATRALVGFGVLPFGLVAAFGPPLFEFVFGAGWHEAGVYARWLALWMFLQYANVAAVAAVPVLGMQHTLLVYELFSTGAKVAALWIGYAVFGNDLAAIALFCGAGIIAYLWLIAWVIRRAGSGATRRR